MDYGSRVMTTEEVAEQCGVSPRNIRHYAAQGRITGARKVHKAWVFDPNWTLIRPPERWNRRPEKMKLPYDQISTDMLIKHMKYWLENTN
jgi:hypothetical protein